MIDSSILDLRSHYSFDIVTSMGMPTSSIYMSHIYCISPIDGNHINTKTKSHHAPAPEAPPLDSKSYYVSQPYVELLPSHIRGQYVNPKTPPHSSQWPTTPKDTTSQHSLHSIIPSIWPPHLQKSPTMKKRDKNPKKRAQNRPPGAKALKRG